jgi:hypothetical protein
MTWHPIGDSASSWAGGHLPGTGEDDEEDAPKGQGHGRRRSLPVEDESGQGGVEPDIEGRRTSPTTCTLTAHAPLAPVPLHAGNPALSVGSPFVTRPAA